MRVAFNARVLSNPVLRGWNRYTLNLASALAELGVPVFLYLHREIDPAQLAQLTDAGLTIRQARPMSYLRWEQQWIPRQCADDGVDVFHSPVHSGLPQWTRAKCVLTLHDAIETLYYARRRRPTASQRMTEVLYAMARHRADHVITVSEHSRRDLMELFGFSGERISVTYEAADRRFHEPVCEAKKQRVRAKYGLPQRFLFYVGSMEQRKNLVFLLRAVARAHCSELRLVLGGGDEAQGRTLMQIARDLGIAERVVLLGRIDDEDLPAMYGLAEAFVYPSEYEGFGLQLCEAMAAGCPVLAADASCLPEIVGDGGDVFPLADPAVLGRMIRRLVDEPEYGRNLRARGLARARAFSWRHTAEATLRVYEKVCRNGRG